MDGKITISASTLDEAITKALIELQTTSEHLHYEVVQKESAGLLGIFGKKPCIIRAHVMSEAEEKELAEAKKLEEKKAAEAKREEEAKKALLQVGFKEKNFKKSPFDLSGGQKKRVAIAGVLAMNPKILILDEPTAGLDPKGRDEILDQIAELHKVRGITIILVSHSMEDVANYVDRIIVMNKGSVMLDGVPKDVFAHYKELEEVGLAAPAVTYIMQQLKQNGFAVSTDATTIEEAKEEILRALHRAD